MDKKVQDGNREIAIFTKTPYKFKKVQFSDKRIEKEEERLPPYHSEWQWLMSAWECVAELKATPTGVGITVLNFMMLTQGGFRAHINYRKKYNGIQSVHKSFDVTQKDPLKAMWTVLSKFSKWYNTQTKNS